MTTPFPYQVEDADALANGMKGRGILAHSMGLGKSFTALLTAQRLNNSRPMVVICPAVVKENWRRECLIHAGLAAEILEGTRPPTNTRRFVRSPILIINYDILGQRRGENSGPGWLPFLKSIKPQIVVIDESHMLASLRSLRTRCVRELCKGVPHVLALSGTPLVNKPMELWPTLNIVRPDLFKSWWSFAREFCRPTRKPWGWDYSGSSNLPKLHRELDGVMLRRRKEDVLKQLPPKRRIVLPLEIKGRKKYDKAVNDFVGWMIENHGKGKALRAIKAERLVQLGYLKRLAAQLKLPAVMDWLDDYLIESDGKVIVFAIHKKIVAALHERYKDQSVVVSGDVTGEDRQLAIDRFQGHKKTRVLIGNLQAAGVGWNGTAAEAVVFAELGWTPGGHLQAEDRAHRIGQTQSVSVYYLTAKDTLEEKLVELLQRKMTVLSKVLDGRSKQEGDLDIHDLLCKQLMKAGSK